MVRCRISGDSFKYRARYVIWLHFGDASAELLERPADLAREARFRGGLQLRIPLARLPQLDRLFA